MWPGDKMRVIGTAGIFVRHSWPLERTGRGGGGLMVLVASREKAHFQAMPDRINRKLDRGATSPAVILCSCVGSGALFLIRGRIPVPLSRSWRLFDPRRPIDVRRFSPGLAGARCRDSRAGSLPTVMAPRVRRPARGTVAAAHGVPAAAAARVGAAAVLGMTATARVRVVRELTDEAVILIRNVRRPPPPPKRHHRIASEAGAGCGIVGQVAPVATKYRRGREAGRASICGRQPRGERTRFHRETDEFQAQDLDSD